MVVLSELLAEPSKHAAVLALTFDIAPETFC